MTLKILRANGSLSTNGAENPSFGNLSYTGGSDRWSDGSDSTYINTESNSPLGYTVGLEPLVGYEDGDLIYLRVRMSMDGGGDPPDCLPEIFISTDAAGTNEIAAFSSGFSSDYAFKLDFSGNGEIVEAYVPIRLAGFPGVTMPDVVAALEAGAYIDVNALINWNAVEYPVANRIYELQVEVGQDVLSPCSQALEPTNVRIGGGPGSDIWNDGDDGTYATADWYAGSEPTADLARYRRGEVRDITMHLRASADAAGTLPLLVTLYRENGTTILRPWSTTGPEWSIPGDGVIRDYAYTVSSANVIDDGWTSIADLREDLSTAGNVIVITAVETTPGDSARIYEAWLQVGHPCVTGTPPRRLHPRDDGRGVGIGHIYPPPASLQHGRRTGGATYL